MSYRKGGLSPEDQAALLAAQKSKADKNTPYEIEPRLATTKGGLSYLDQQALNQATIEAQQRAAQTSQTFDQRTQQIYEDYQRGNITSQDVKEYVDNSLKSQGLTEKTVITEAPAGYYYKPNQLIEYNRQVIEYNRALHEYRRNLIQGITAPPPKPPVGYGTKTEKEPDMLEMVLGPPQAAPPFVGPPEPPGFRPGTGIPGPGLGPKPGSIGADLQARVTGIFDTRDISSAKLWGKSREYDEAEVMKLAGVLPYSPKGVYQAAGIIMGSVENITAPILNLIPGRQPFEVMPGEPSVDKNLLKAELSPRDLQVAKMMGAATEVGLTVGLGAVSGKAVKIAGELVSSVPLVGGPAASAAKYLLKPRPITTALIGGGLVAAEGAKVLGMVEEGAELGEIAGEVGLDAVKLYAFDVGFSKGLGSKPFLESARESLPVKYGEVSVPVEGGGTVEWKGVYLSKGDDAALLTGKVTLKGAEGGVLATGYVPETNIDSKVTIEAMKRMGYDPTDIMNIEDIRAVISKTQGVTSKYIDDLLPTETGTLSEKGVKTLKEFLTKNIGEVEQVYGSYATLPQLKTDVEYTLTVGSKTISALRTPGDIDIQLLTAGDDATKFAEKLTAELLKAGETVRISTTSPTLIEASVGGGKWAHAIDIHTAGDITDTIPSVRAWGFNLDRASIKIEGFPAMGAGEQGIRKGVSMMGIQDTGIGPAAHRMKDIPDFFQVQDTLLSSKKIPDLKTEARLEALLGRYGGMEKLLGETGVSAAEITLPAVRYTYRPPPFNLYSAASPIVYLASPSLGITKPSPPSPSLPSLSVSPPAALSPSASLPSMKVSSSPYDTGYKPSPPSPPSPSSPPSIPIPTYTSPPYKPPSPPKPPSIPKYPSPPYIPSFPKTPSQPKTPSIPLYPSPPKQPPSTPPGAIPLPYLPVSEREEKRRKRRGAFEERTLPLATEKQIRESVLGPSKKLKSIKI